MGPRCASKQALLCNGSILAHSEACPERSALKLFTDNTHVSTLHAQTAFTQAPVFGVISTFFTALARNSRISAAQASSSKIHDPSSALHRTYRVSLDQNPDTGKPRHPGAIRSLATATVSPAQTAAPPLRHERHPYLLNECRTPFGGLHGAWRDRTHIPSSSTLADHQHAAEIGTTKKPSL